MIASYQLPEKRLVAKKSPPSKEMHIVIKYFIVYEPVQ